MLIMSSLHPLCLHAKCVHGKKIACNVVADPGFPVGGVDLRRGHFSVKMYAKRKELFPRGVGGVRRAGPLNPPMQWIWSFIYYKFSVS